MTNEEAIKILDDITSYCDFTDEYGDMINSTPYFEALDLAIKALEQQPIEDAVSREDALKAIEEQKKGFYGVERYAIDECHSAVMKLPSVTPKARWIPVSERLPERDVDVLAYHRNESFDYQYVSWIDDYSGKWSGFIGNLSDEVLAWQPLPEKYKEAD